jgi:small-conductance mechanosensitive channel
MTRLLPSPRALATLAIALFLVLPHAGLLAQAQDGPSDEIEIDSAPVELDGQLLFRVRGVTSLPAKIRAGQISQRIAEAAADPGITLDDIQVRETGTISRIVAGDRHIMAVSEADARLEQLGRIDLANTHVVRVRQAVHEYREARTPAALRRGLVESIAATVVLVLAVALLWAVTRWLRRLLAQWIHSRVHATHMESFELVRGDRIAETSQQALHLLAGLVLAALIFQYLSFTLSRFPGTRALGLNLSALLVGPLRTMGSGLIDELPDLAFLVVLFILVRMVLRAVRAIFDALGRGAMRIPDFEPEWATPTYKVVRLVIIAFGLVVAYPYLPGSQSEAFKGISIFVGVLISFGSSSAISNVIAGYVLIYRRAFKVGDVVKIGSEIGQVTDFRILATRVRSLKNEEISFPNSQVLSVEVKNYSALARRDGVILHTEVGIGYETPWRQVEAMLLAAAAQTAGIPKTPAPFVLQRALANYSVTYELNVYCSDPWRMLDIFHELHRHILDVFNQYGVQIMTPAYMADPVEPKVVKSDHWYIAPASPPNPES